MKTGGFPSTALLLLVGALGGCATTQGDQIGASPAPAARARWEAVMLPEATAAPLQDVEWAWWDERRDREIGWREPGPLLASDDWPEPARPTLDRSRTVTLPSRPETIIYFRPDHRRR